MRVVVADDVMLTREGIVRLLRDADVDVVAEAEDAESLMRHVRLARPDVLPATDYGVRKGFARVRGARELPSPKELLAHGERWRPYRTVASWYLWRVLDL